MVIEKIFVSWDEISQNIELLHNRTSLLDGTNTAIVGIARGGLIPATLLSQYKPGSTVFSVGVKSYIRTQRDKEIIYQSLKKSELEKFDTIYLIDDICDTGLTFKFLLEKYFSGVNIKTISLFYRSNSLYCPNFFGTKLLDESWVVFPWEKE